MTQTEKMQKKLDSLWPNHFNLLDYLSAWQPIVVECKKCGAEICYSSWSNWIYKKFPCNCMKHEVNRNPKTQEEKQEEIDNKYGKNNCKIIKYSTASSPVTIECQLCKKQKTYKNTAIFMRRKSSCDCSSFNRKTNKNFPRINELLLDYANVENSILYLKKKYGLSHHVILQMVKDSGNNIRFKNNKFEEKNKSGWYDRYLSGEPVTEIAKSDNISTSLIYQHFEANNFKMKESTFWYSPELKVDFFEEIDTEEKAYFLGLLITDGFVLDPPDRQNIIGLELTESDGYMVEKFKKILKSNNQTYLRHYNSPNRRPTLRINVCSNKMALDLSKFGVVPRKSNKTFLPKILPALMPHLIRGLIDGNGSVLYYPRKNNVTISFCGCGLIVKQLHKFLTKELKLNKTKVITRYKDHNLPLDVFNFHSKKDFLAIGHYIYDGATIYLKRKNQVFKSFLNHVNTEEI